MRNILIFIISMFFALSAYALDLQQAKDQGLIGEANTGFVAPVTSRPSPAIRDLVNAVNRVRQEQYQKIAVTHGLTVREVGHLAHKKAMEKTEPGHYYQDPSGMWVKK
ncbi:MULTISPECIES: YdbL family protein [Photobacterium]|uniref:DUF1318 domain-containing protein n=1 Tax=Photobacterium ganghwense TaxID=320778 RepID=A0A0J1K065_9GAMM|nr:MULTISPECIES: YdbL family protein [Photobacterium]KLV07862.1 hypothetical protein ABT57_13400 [Photobacterium ganghwense]MBV1842122.1 YdbL family protein [Photobacterium ganghwense]PSU06959.1 DUF1318 domain-containing protein [Photobacterium ganghwense]QSV15711.1 YdbL family protein [Photobacterium ganghwense]